MQNEWGRLSEWAHSPTHLFVPKSAYFVTGSTYGKLHHFRTPARRTHLLEILFEQAERFRWNLQAWAILSNHYHFLGIAPDDPKTLISMLRAVHSKTARFVNAADGAAGRKVWFQYRDTCLTNERSYYARLNYVHHNPEKHGVVPNAENYPWCSMAWFLREATPGHRRKVLSFKYDKLNVQDDF